MNVEEMILKIYEKDNIETYNIIQELERISFEKEDVYKYMKEFINCINDKKSYVRWRAIALISANAKWDKDNIIDKNINNILKHTEDEKPIVSRKYVQELENIIKYKPNLIPIIKERLLNIDLVKYKESMSGLIKKDIKKVLDNI